MTEIELQRFEVELRQRWQAVWLAPPEAIDRSLLDKAKAQQQELEQHLSQLTNAQTEIEPPADLEQQILTHAWRHAGQSRRSAPLFEEQIQLLAAADQNLGLNGVNIESQSGLWRIELLVDMDASQRGVLILDVSDGQRAQYLGSQVELDFGGQQFSAPLTETGAEFDVQLDELDLTLPIRVAFVDAKEEKAKD